MTAAVKVAVRDQLLDLLVAAAKERDQRQGIVTVNDRAEFGWVEHERHVMLAAVNEWRLQHALSPASHAAVVRCESMAIGHSDYGNKFALYCAELAMGDR